MKEYILGTFVIMIALVLAFSFSAFRNSHKIKNHTTDFYYEFTGTHGNESNMSLWTQLPTLADYGAFTCTHGSTNSCKIINTTNSGTHPTSVPLDVNGFPQTGATNTEVKLKQ